MKRYLRLYWQFIRINLSLLSVYRANLLNHLINSLTWAGFLYISMFLLTQRITSIFGWDRNHLLVLAAMYNMVIGIFYMIFSRSFRDLAEIIYMGKLDTYLLKPIDSQFHVSLQEVNVPGAIRLVLGASLVSLLLNQLSIHLSVMTFLVTLVMTLVSVLFLYSSWFLILTLLIWFPRLDNLNDFLYSSSGMGKYPREVLKPFSGTVFFFLALPFFMTVSVPTKALFGEAGALEMVAFAAAAFVLLICSRIFWKFALRFYVGGSV